MEKVKLPYRLKTRLADEIEQEQARQTLHFEKRISIDDEESYFSDCCYGSDYPKYPHKVHYWIKGTDGKALDIIIWTERIDV